MIESEYGRAFQARASVALPDVRLFRRNVGFVRTADDRVFKAGIPGQCDFYAIERGGRHAEIEIKNVRGRLSEAQERWRDWCRAWGVAWILLEVRAGEAPSATIERWIAELRA